MSSYGFGQFGKSAFSSVALDPGGSLSLYFCSIVITNKKYSILANCSPGQALHPLDWETSSMRNSINQSMWEHWSRVVLIFMYKRMAWIQHQTPNLFSNFDSQPNNKVIYLMYNDTSDKIWLKAAIYSTEEDKTANTIQLRSKVSIKPH